MRAGIRRHLASYREREFLPFSEPHLERLSAKNPDQTSALTVRADSGPTRKFVRD
jgi:hypothetical protein